MVGSLGTGTAADRISFGGLLRAHRDRRLLSQERLAERSGLSVRTLRALEQGQISRPRAASVRLLVDALQLQGAERETFEAAARGRPPAHASSALEASDRPGARPFQLPPDVVDFTGRAAELSEVVGLLTGRDAVGSRPTAVVVSAIAGKPGVGKTTLAVRVAHQLRTDGWFPDGQLFVNLQGTRTRPLEPGEALARFLRALGVDGTAIPHSLDERAERYRGLLADRRVLVVLDDAACEGQVRALLPGSGSCGVLVTSRARLVGLEGVRLLDLDVLEPEPALQLLGTIASSERVAAEPDAAAAIVRYCGGLPLAIRIAGARLAARPSWPLERLAGRLADQRRRLDELAVGDLEVRASIALSYQALPDLQQRAFRRLGLLDVPDFAVWVVAALLDLTPRRAEVVVDQLVDAQLLEVAGEDAAGQLRYRVHDLLRVYARECAAEEPEPVGDAALTRAFGAWLALVEAADQRLPSPALGLAHGTALRWPERPADSGWVDQLVSVDPVAWLEAERAALVAVVAQASGQGQDELAWDLAYSLTGFYSLQAHLDDWRHTQELSLAATQRAGNRRGHAYALRGLGQLHIERDDLSAAMACLQQAVARFDDLDDRYGWAYTLTSVGYVHRLQGHPEEALACFERALEALTSLGDLRGRAYVLWNFGLTHREQGRLAEAGACLKQALDGFRAVGDRRFEAWVLRSLGMLRQAQGQTDEAMAAFAQALELVTALGDRFGQAMVLEAMGESHPDRGQAGMLLEQALQLARELNNAFAQARALRGLGDLHSAAGHLAEAESFLRDSLALWEQLQMPLWCARTLHSLGAVQAARGQHETARTTWQRALALFEDLGAPEAERLVRQLKRLPQALTTPRSTASR